MIKIFTIEVGNSAESERASYDKAEIELSKLEKEGWSIVSTLWDTGGLGGGQDSGVVVFLHKK